MYSLVVPCFNEQESLPIFYKAVVPVMESLKTPFEIVFVNDGSRDKTAEILAEYAKNDKRVKAVNFSRNFGQQPAIFAGLSYAKGDAVICLDCDLQDPVEVIPQMIEKWKDGAEIVHARRTKRVGESFLKKITSTMYLKFLKRVSRLDVPARVGEFKLMDKKVVKTLCEMPEHYKNLRGQIGRAHV
jgi:dolichol-phosphate mannosyltransferase